MNDFIGMVGRKAGNEALKNFIRSTNHPYIAEQKCNVIDAMENTEHFMRFVNEINEWEMRRRYAIYKWVAYGSKS